MIVETDLEGNLIYANQKVFELTGYTREDLNAGLNAMQLVVPEDGPAVARNMRRLLDGEELRGSEYTGLRKDGTTFPVVVYTSYKVMNGQANRMRSIIVDVTEKKKEELIRDALIAKLQKAVSEIRALRGIIPICSHCKKIRTDKGYYLQLETYLCQHTEAQFSHGICPDCLAEHYG